MTTVEGPLADLLALAQSAAREAGAELLSRFGGEVEGLEAKSSSTDPVSAADRASEAILKDRLLGARPGDGLISEEGAAADSETGLTWVIDPLDGTVNYLYGFDSWAVSVALEDDQGALVGVVHQPTTDRTYWAVRGGGAWQDDKRLHVNDPVPMERALLATGYSYLPERRAKSGPFIGALVEHVRDIRRIGSGALELCWVAAGQVDAYLEEDIKHWDWAAGVLLVREAGGVFDHVTPTGASTGLVAAGKQLIGQILRHIHTSI